MLKSGYVSGVKRLRDGLLQVGAIKPLDGHGSSSRHRVWLRSLVEIYSVDGLVALDRPWWTFEASDIVDAFLLGRTDARVFEWGSGASTVWLAKRSAGVTAVEHDVSWADQVDSLVGDNVEVVRVPPTPVTPEREPVRSKKEGYADLDFSDYVAAIDRDEEKYDVIVVDGRAREACLLRAMAHLAPGGMIVFDNVERSRYRSAIAQLGSAVSVVWTTGLTPCLPYPTRTALLTTGRT